MFEQISAIKTDQNGQTVYFTPDESFPFYVPQQI